MYLVQTVTSGMRPTRAPPRDNDGSHLVSSQPGPPSPACSYTPPLASPSHDKTRPHFTPANIRSYLDNTEPIYQNEKFYELITPQKFVKPSQKTSIKSSDSFNKIPPSPRLVPALPPSPDVKPKNTKHVDMSPSSPGVKPKNTKHTDMPPSWPDNKPKTTKHTDISPSSPEVKEEKKKKWSLGGLFRRRRKKTSDTESSSAEEDSKLGFLARRRSRREKRKQRGKKTEETNLLRVDQATSQESLPGSRDRSRHVDSSGGSGSVDGSTRRERRLAAMQRSAVAHTNASSSEDDSCKTNSLHRSGSLNRRSRYARTERYIKRLSRDEETVLQREAAALQHRTSRNEEAALQHRRSDMDQSDADARCYITSATPSPGQSPLVRPKNTLRLSSSVPHATASNPASLERRSHHRLPWREGHSPLPPSCDPKRQHESFRSPGQRSLSYDNNIHRVPTSPQDNVMCVQFPVARISQFGGPGFVAVRPNPTTRPVVKLGPPPPPPRDPLRRVTPLSPSRPMSYAFEDGTLPVRRNQNGSYLSLDNHATSYNHNNPISGDNRCNSENPIASAFYRPASATLVETSSNRRNTPQFQYYADQSPRSRKPIHIQQVSEKNPVSQVTAFWKQRELETSSRNSAMRLAVEVPQSPGSSVDNVSLLSPNVDENDQRALSMVLETQEQWSLNSQRQELTPKMKYLLDCLPSDIEHTTKSETLNHGIFTARPVVSDVTARSQEKVVAKARSTFSSPKPRFSFPEPAITSKDFGQPLTTKPGKASVPPEPPVRRYSRHLSSSSLEAEDEMQALFTRTAANLQDGKQTPVCSSNNMQDGKQTPVRSSANLQDGKQTPVRSSANLQDSKQTPVRTATNLDRDKQSPLSNATNLQHDKQAALGTPTNLEKDKQTPLRSAANLEDALDELEAIYKSLQLGDDDLLDRAERRDLPTKFQLREPLPEPLHASLTGSVSDSGYELTPARKRAPSSRRSGIPDRVADDMAYRRLHPKDRPDSQNIVSQAGSFLLTSPTMQANAEEHLRTSEPDVTYDDVVYRNNRHVNNALKVVEPQLPFGIPVGPIAPAANSDYLHATPSDRYRPTFKPRRTPDVVSDDLAYRALRKEGTTRDGTLFHGTRLDDTKKKEGTIRDGTLFHGSRLDEFKKKEGTTRDGTISMLPTRDGNKRWVDDDKRKTGAMRDGTMFHGSMLDDDKRKAGAMRDVSSAVDTALHNARLNDTNFSLRKRRAIRSLSANLPSLIVGDRNNKMSVVNVTTDNFEKAQSLTHLPDALEIAQKILEGKEVIGGGPNNAKWNEVIGGGPNNAMWNVPVLRAGDRNSTTSTETLTDSRANLATLHDKRGSWQQRVRVNGAPPLAGMADTNREIRNTNRDIRDRGVERKEEPKKDLNHDIRDRCKDTEEEQNMLNADSPLNGTQIEDLLSALARDARSTSEQLGLQLAGFSTSEQLAGFNTSVQFENFNSSQQLLGFNSSEELTGYNTSVQLADFDTREELTGFNTSKLSTGLNTSKQSSGCDTSDQLRDCNTSDQLTGLNTSELVDLQSADLRSKQVCSNSEQKTCDKLSDDITTDDIITDDIITDDIISDDIITDDIITDDIISDDSLDVKDQRVEDSDEPMTALEDLHIYEPCDAAPTNDASEAELDALTGEDEEIQAIFRLEDLRNNNEACGKVAPPVAKPRGKEVATTSAMTGEAGLVLLAGTYCTQHALAQDWLTVIAICIAVVALLAFLML